MGVDDVGDVTITNDGATILQLLEVEHPAAKVLVELAALQDEEVGDGTTSVVIIAAELLKNADELVKQKIHPTSIIAGYRLASKEAVKYIKEHLTLKVDDLGEECLINCTIAAQQMPRTVTKAKIAVLDFSLQKVKMKMGVQLLVNDPAELERMRDRESDITKERINKILATGANVILTTGGIDDLCLKYFVEAGAMAVRRCKRQDLKR